MKSTIEKKKKKKAGRKNLKSKKRKKKRVRSTSGGAAILNSDQGRIHLGETFEKSKDEGMIWISAECFPSRGIRPRKAWMTCVFLDRSVAGAGVKEEEEGRSEEEEGGARALQAADFYSEQR